MRDESVNYNLNANARLFILTLVREQPEEIVLPAARRCYILFELPSYRWCVRPKACNLYVNLLTPNVLQAAGMFLLSNFEMLVIRVLENFPTSY